jgi:hypothetical protein
LGERTDKVALVVKYGGRGVDVMLSIEEAEEAEALVVKHGVSTIEEARSKEAEEQARRKAAEQARRKAAEQARKQAEEQARRKAAEQARRKAAEQARREAEEQARRKAAEQARREEEERLRKEAAERVRREAAERVRREAEEKARREEAAATRAGWATHLDAKIGKQFWAHAQSGASQWDVPTAAQLRQQEAKEKALMAKYGVNTIEEARMAAAIGAGTVLVVAVLVVWS